MEAAPDIVTKGEFAALINVSPGRVSQYISEGKLHGPALAGEGRSARIVVPVARQQLRRSLDASQMIGNGLETRLAALKPKPAPVDDDDDVEVREGDLLADQIKAEKLKEIRARNRRFEEEDRARRGLYTSTADVRRALRKVADQSMQMVDGGLANMASEIAGKYQIPQRDVLHLLKLEMRKIRTAAATAAKRRADEIAPTIDDEFEPEAE